MSVKVRYSDELYHYGKKGMHWGERKYQNEDGSYTPLGRIHYGIGKARSTANSGVTKIKKIASESSDKAKTGVKNAAVTTGKFIKTNAPVVAKKVGTTAGNAAKKTGTLALAGGAAVGAFAAANAPKVSRVIKRTAEHYTPDEILKRRTQKLRAKADYNSAVAYNKRSKYEKKYAKKNAKEQRKLNKWRYQDEKRKHTIEGKMKSKLLEVVDVAGKIAPFALLLMTMRMGGGFDLVNKASQPLANSIQSFTNNPEIMVNTAEGQAILRQIVDSTRTASGGYVNLSSLQGMANVLGGNNAELRSRILADMQRYI